MSYIIRQPNGRYAIFREGSHLFLALNLTREAIAATTGSHGRIMEGALRFADTDDDAPGFAAVDGPHGSRRWRGALDVVRRVRGKEEAESIRLVGETPPPRAKVTVGYVVADSLPGGRRQYLGATIRGGHAAGWWSESQRAAIRFLTKTRAAKMAKNYTSFGVRTARVIRLWRWV